MPKVRVKVSGGCMFIHHFLTEPEARAYIMAIKEMDNISNVCSWIMSITLDGKEV